MGVSEIINISLVFFGLTITVVGSLITYAVGNSRRHGEHRARFAKLETAVEKDDWHGTEITNMKKEIQSLRESLIAHGVSINK